MRLEAAEKAGLFSVTIQLEEAFTAKGDTPPEGFRGQWVRLREPDEGEITRMNEKNENACKKVLDGILENCIEESSYDDDNGPAPKEQVWAFIKRSASVYIHVVEAWQKALPLVKQNKNVSVSAQESSSTAGA